MARLLQVEQAQEPTMAHVSSHGRLPGDLRHRADEIHVHRASWWQAFGPLLGLLALLALVALGAWAYMRGRAHTVAQTRPEITEPNRMAPAQGMRELPPPPQIEPPAAAVAPPEQPAMEAPKAVAPQEPFAPTVGGAPSPAKANAAPSGTAAAKEEETSEKVCSSGTTVYFPTDATVFKDQGVTSLNYLADCLKAEPTRVVRLEGRADPRGSEDRNAELATGRASAVAEQLWALGVPTGQIMVSTAPSACPENHAACWPSDRSVKAILSETTQP